MFQQRFQQVLRLYIAVPAVKGQLLGLLEQGNRAIADSYTRFYTVGAKPAFGPETIEAFSCAILNATPGEYQKCYTDIADFIRREFSGLQPAE